eukprot:2659780-Rhodomonas_salina.3
MLRGQGVGAYLTLLILVLLVVALDALGVSDGVGVRARGAQLVVECTPGQYRGEHSTRVGS